VTIASVNRGPTHLKDPSLYLNAFPFQQVSFTLSDMPLRFFKMLLKDATIHEPNMGAPGKENPLLGWSGRRKSGEMQGANLRIATPSTGATFKKGMAGSDTSDLDSANSI